MADQIGKATPGKWTAEIDADDPTACIAIEKDGAQIAIVYNVEDFPCVGEDEEERVQAECIANARLIAAAPDLRDALVLLARLSWAPDMLPPELTLGDIRAQVESAISKAEGLTP